MPLGTPEPVLVLDLLPAERCELLALLDGLPAEVWRRPTACPGWSVFDVALHLLGGELAWLARGRDGLRPLTPRPDEALVPFLNRINDEWVVAARRLSPRVLCDLLRRSGQETHEYVASLDPFEPGERVSWAGPGPAPRWLHVAREYTERWVHQQQIREAVGAPLLDAPRFLAPVLATFARALPRTFDGVVAPADATVGVVFTGPSGSAWTVVSGGDGRWELRGGRPEHAPTATVELDEDAAWRLFTKGLTPRAARARATIHGDQVLGERALHNVAIIA